MARYLISFDDGTMIIPEEELPEGTLVTVAEGLELRRERFEPDRAYQEQPLPAVWAPGESELCLARLAALAAPA